jgi:long-chain acyl-CoA synthetase
LEKPWVRHYDAGVPASLRYPDIILTEFLAQSAQKYPDQACTIFDRQVVTFSQMNSLVNRFAGTLKSLGVFKGERVGILLPNVPQFVLAFYAILKAGGVVVALNPQYKLRELEYQTLDSGLRLVIAQADLATLMEQLCDDIPQLKVIFTDIADSSRLVDALENHIQPNSTRIDTTKDYRLLDLISSTEPLPENQADVTTEDVAVFQYSGGTTGTPKAAVATHRNLVANTIQFRNWLIGMEDGKEVVLAAIPLYHVYGMVIAMSLGIALGASLVLIQNPRNLDDILTNIEQYHATLFPGVPNMYQSINRHSEVNAGKIKLSSIKACISGSAPLSPETKSRFESLTGGKLMEGYGLSEAPTATHCNPMFGENRAGSIGLPLPDVDCRIVDLEEGRRELAHGEKGELVLKGPQVMRGYHQRPDEDQITLVDGWLHTGDIAWMDDDGYFYLVDRKKELIKIGGFQVWPREVEEVIAMHLGVKESAVSGVLDEEHEEFVKAWVVLNPGSKVTEDEIRVWCKQYLANYKVPSVVAFRENLPRTTVGKVLRRELRRMHQEGLA